MRVRIKRAILMTITLAPVALVIGGISYLRSARFQERARSAIITRVERATGLRAGLERFSLDILRGRFSVSRFELKSRTKTGSYFEFSVDEVSGSFRIAALWRPKIDLVELKLVHPRFLIHQEPGGKPWHLEPILRRSLDVAARRATILNGWVELDNRRIPLNLVVNALNCSIQYRPSPQSYAIQLTYKNSPLQWAGRKFVYDLSANVNLLPTGLEIVSYDLREDKSRFNGSGSLDNWNAPALHVTTSGIFSGDDLTLITSDLKYARGDVSVSGDLRLDAHEFYMSGRFAAETVHYRQTVAQALRGLFEIKDNVLLLRGVNGRMGDGGFQVDGAIQLKSAGTPPHHIRVSAKDIVLRDASGLLDLRTLALANKVDGEATLDWRRGQDDLEVEGVADLHGMTAASDLGPKTALNGTAEFSFRRKTWYLKKIELDSPDTSIQASGSDPERSRIKIQMDTTRPAEIFSLVRGFSPTLQSAIESDPELMGISGRFLLDGDILLHLPEAMAYEGQVIINSGRWRHYALDRLKAIASWDGARLQLRELNLMQGTQSAEGKLILEVPQGGATPDFRFDGTVRRVSLASLRDQGIDFNAQVAGILSGQGWISYKQGVLEGDGQFQIETGNYNGEAFDIPSAAVRVKDRVLHIVGGQLKRGSALVSVEGQVNLDTRQMGLQARLKELPLSDIPEVKSSKIAVDGRVTASGEIRGTPEQPEFKGNIEVDGLSYAGWNLGAGKAAVDLHERILSVNNIDVRSELGGFRGRAWFSITPGYPGGAKLEFSDWDVRKILARNASELLNDFSTALHGNLEIEGNFAEFSKLRYSGELDGARFKIHGYELRNNGPIRFIATSEKVEVQNALLVGEGSSLAIEKGGVIPLGEEPALKLQLTGKLNLGFLDRLNPKVGVSGSAVLNVSVTGSRLAPELIGNAVLEDTRVVYDDLPYPFSALRGSLIFSRNSVRLESITGAVALGTIQLTGSVEHQKGELQGMNLHGLIRNARLHYPKDFISTVDADLSLRGGTDARVLTGDVTVLRAQYLKDFNVLEQFIGRSSGPSGPQLTNPLLAGTRLLVSVRSASGLFIDNELTRVQGKMDLTLRGTLAYPSVAGRAEAIEGAIFFRGNRFDIVHASADFLDRNRIIPVLDVRAEADVRSYRLRLDLSGDLEHLRLNVSSDPPLSNIDIVSLLTTGKSDQMGVENPRHQAEMTGLSAASILSESLTGVIGKRVERIFGLSSFRVDPYLAGAENDPTARVTISERLSKDLTVTFSRNLTTNKQQIIVVEYDVNKDLSIVATRDEDGKYGVDFRFRKRFR